MAKGAERSRIVTTAGNTFSQWTDSLGRTYYRKNGKFVSSRAYNSARRHAVEVETEATLNVDPRRPMGTQREIAYTDDAGNWRAGPDVKRYRPDLNPGDLIDNDTPRGRRTLTELREARGRERNFFAFSTLDENDGLSREEIKARYFEFLDAIAEAENDADRYEILRAYGWPGY